MKCFTLKADRQVLAVPTFNHPMTYIAPELYPEPVLGIKAHRLQSDIEIAPGLKANLSQELLQSCKVAPGDPESIIIERASLERRPGGVLVLVPEKLGEDASALVFVDLGRGAFSSVRYEVGNRVFLRARKPSDELFGFEELALVEVPVGRPFSAYRSSRRWYCFGGDVVGEQLQIRFDGQQLKCELAR